MKTKTNINKWIIKLEYYHLYFHIYYLIYFYEQKSYEYLFDNRSK